MARWIEVERRDGKDPELLDYVAGSMIGIFILLFIAVPLSIVSLFAIAFKSMKSWMKEYMRKYRAEKGK